MSESYATMTIKASVKSDAWADYEWKWKCFDQGTFDITNPSHFGWCVGGHFLSVARQMCNNDNVAGQSEALRGLAARLRDAADELEEENPEEKP
jgi:hypothetical protein